MDDAPCAPSSLIRVDQTFAALGGPSVSMPPVVTLLVAVALGASGAPRPALQLQVAPLQESYRTGESVVVRIVVRNPHGSGETWYLKRGFWIVPYSYPMDGDLGLRITVTDPAGKQLESTTESMLVVRAQTNYWDFAPLSPGQLFGQELALDDPSLGYDLGAPGTYRIVASVTPAQAREWFDRWEPGVEGAKGHWLSREELFDGSLVSAGVTVTIVSGGVTEQGDAPEDERKESAE